MTTARLLLLTLATVLALGACQETLPDSQGSILKGPSLKEAYAEDFLIGAAVNRAQIQGTDSQAVALIEREFNSLTPENVMKWMHIHPEADRFDFELPDQFVALGERNDMFLVGHTLVWHSQLAKWAQEITDSLSLASAMENHINTIVGRYKGRIRGWDVVNEALNDDGTLRETIFLQHGGPGYIRRAFALAAAADPEAELYYNDYSMTNPAKRKGAIALIQLLQASDTKIDGVGLQAHWGLESPSLKEIEESILEYSALGIKVMFTEMDITVIPNPWDFQGADISKTAENSAIMDPYATGLPDSVQAQLAQRYEDIFTLFLKHADKISRVTFWGVYDGQSWKNDWPIKGRTNYPLLFDRNFQPKPAYDRVMALKAKQNM